jgi:hypothetical protein
LKNNSTREVQTPKKKLIPRIFCSEFDHTRGWNRKEGSKKSVFGNSNPEQKPHKSREKAAIERKSDTHA